ncbi:MAG TPA: hypothetical protein V6D07_04630 [Trichocoleus sp.]
MQSRNPYEADNQSQSLENGRVVTDSDLVQENERLRYERLRQTEALRNNNLASENERLRYERADRDSSGAVGGLVIGLLVFCLAILGIGAFYYLGRDTGASEVSPPTTQPQEPQVDSPDINITAPQPPPQVNVQPPDVNVQTPQVNVEPPQVNVEAPTPPAIQSPAPAGSSTDAPAVDPQAGQGTAPETTTAPGTNP